MQKVFLLEMTKNDEGFVEALTSSFEALETELEKGWRVIGTTPILSSSNECETQVTSQVIYILEQNILPKRELNREDLKRFLRNPSATNEPNLSLRRVGYP